MRETSSAYVPVFYFIRNSYFDCHPFICPGEAFKSEEF